MSARSESNGHPIEFDGEVWRYVDTGALVDHERACAACGMCPVLVTMIEPYRLLGVTVDACVAPLVQALNNAGFKTRWSCCGHQHRPGTIGLDDGRQLIIGQPPKEGTWPEGVHSAFVDGAKWWQFHHNGSTMFGSERDEAEAEAVRRYGPVQSSDKAVTHEG